MRPWLPISEVPLPLPLLKVSWRDKTAAAAIGHAHYPSRVVL